MRIFSFFFSLQVSRYLPEKQGEIEALIKDLRQLEDQLNHLLLWLSPIRNQLEVYNQPNQTGPFDIKVRTFCFKRMKISLN